MQKLIVLNHKMNLEYDQVYDYISKLNEVDTSNNIVVLPSDIYLENFISHSSWGVGAQDVSDKLDGNYTGEISTIQLKSMGIEYALIGHYDRRKYFREKDVLINKKLNACLDSNIMPIVCFGETGNIDDIKSSLDTLLKDVDNIHFIIFAYQPINVSDTNNIDLIYDYLYDKYKVIPNIIYGGSINNKNISDIMKLEKVNGVLIGKASSDIDKIIKVINNIK